MGDGARQIVIANLVLTPIESPPHPNPLPHKAGGEGTGEDCTPRPFCCTPLCCTPQRDLFADALPQCDALLQLDALSQLDALFAWADFGLHLTRPWSVVLTGRPNVGKSSLINRLLGYERAIVFDQPGTTRDVVTGETALDGWPVLLADTAGLREGAEELEAAGMALARQRLATADLRVVLIDLGEPPTPEDERLLAEWPDAMVVAHKCDRPDRWLSRVPAGARRVSSRTGEGVDELQRLIVERLVPRVPPPGTAIPISARHVELLRAARAALSAGDAGVFDASVASLLNFAEPAWHQT